MINIQDIIPFMRKGWVAIVNQDGSKIRDLTK